jgi:hypothetical protein
MLDRAGRLNDDPYFLYAVDEIIVFGSYLSSEPTLGDIDVGILLVRKEANSRIHWNLCDQRSADAGHASDFDWAEREVVRHLKGRGGSISVLDLNADREFIENQQHRVVFRHTVAT